MSVQQWCVRLALVAVSASLQACGTAEEGGGTERQGEEYAKYALIVDAGSTGSRLRMFNYSGDAMQEIKVSDEDKDAFQVEPGLSSYADEPAKAAPSLKPLLEAAQRYIPKEHQQGTRLWVKATAGMRLLERSKISKVFGGLSAGLQKDCPFKFVSGEVLGGEEEALFAWMGVNANLGKLFQGPEVTNGVLDMGGASMQLAFNPGVDILSNEFSFYVHSQRMSIYAKSFIKFGLESVVDRARLALARDAGEDVEQIDDPCLNRGYSENKTVDGRLFEFAGKGDAAACSVLVDSLLGLDVGCLFEPCSLHGTHMAPIQTHKKFWGLSNFFYIPNGLGLIDWNEMKVLTPKAVKDSAESFCGKDLAEAMAVSHAKWKYKKHHCLGGLYMYKVLKAFGFEDSSTHITFAREVEGQSADWSQGAALYETQYMPINIDSRSDACPVESKAKQANAAVSYVLMVDAGSTGSRLRIFKSEGDSMEEVSPSHADEDAFQVEPGLSSFADRPKEAGASLVPLFTGAKKYIPEDKQSGAKLWVKATAGLRLMERSKLTTLVDDMNSYLRQSENCPFHFMSAETLGGEEEAVFAWLSVNEHLGQPLDSPEVTNGILDMGGASMQYAFNPGVDILTKKFSFYVHGNRMSLAARSWPAFGLQTVVDRARAALAEKAGKHARQIDDPCLNRGYNEVHSIGGQDCEFTGTGNVSACSKLVDDLMGADIECLLPPCSFYGAHLAPIQADKKFWGISNYFYIPNGLGLLGWSEQKALTPKSVLNATHSYCNMTLAEAKNASQTPWKYKKYHCLGGLYMYKALKSFGFEDDSTRVTFARKIAGKSADWSTGATLYETQLMPVTIPSLLSKDCLEGGSENSTIENSTIAEWITPAEGVVSADRGDALAIVPFKGLAAGAVGLLAVSAALRLAAARPQQVGSGDCASLLEPADDAA